MGHTIEAFILPQALASAALLEMPGARTIPLPQGLCLVPVTDQVFDDLRERYPEVLDPPSEEFWMLSGPLIRAVENISLHGVIAYVETDYFGGVGDQAAAVWENGKQCLAPAKSEKIGPINRALRFLGVRAESPRDEFDSIGLGTHRNNEAWLRKAE